MRNVTIRLDEMLIKACRHAAVEEDKSLSEWIRSILIQTVSQREDWQRRKRQALKRLEKGFHLGGKPLSRTEIYDR